MTIRPRHPAALPPAAPPFAVLPATRLRRALSGALLAVLLAAPVAAQAPASLDPPPDNPRVWADTAAENQIAISKGGDETPLRFRVRRINNKGDETRVVMEAREGNVARLVERNGQPLTAEENKAEIERLTDLRKNPGEIVKHHKDDRSIHNYAEQLMAAMPRAMIWTYAPGQPQLPGIATRQVVLDFEPNPSFKPPSMVTAALTGLAGRIWIDSHTRCLTHVEGHILHQVDYGWGGFFARIRPGGTFMFEQVEAANHRWTYSLVESHLTLRELMVHNAEENAHVHADDFHALPAPITAQQAIDQLLAMNIPTR